MIDLEQKGTGSMESRTVTICSGLDFVNINYTPMIARDPEYAKVRRMAVVSATSQENLSLGVCDQVKLKPACSATETN